MVVIDCLGVHDKSETGKVPRTFSLQLLESSRARLYSAFYPGKAAFHPSLNPPEFGPFMAREMTRRLENNGELPPEIPKLGYNVVPRDRKFVLQHEPAKVCSDPYKIEKGRFAGDQWVDRNGINFVWCPPGKFIMGDNRFEDAKETEVSLSKGFWIGKYEVLPSEGNFFNMGGRPHTKERRNVEFYPGVTGNVDYIADNLYNWNEFSRVKVPDMKAGPMTFLPKPNGSTHVVQVPKEGMPATDAQLGLYANHADKSLYSGQNPCIISTLTDPPKMALHMLLPPRDTSAPMPGVSMTCMATWLNSAPISTPRISLEELIPMTNRFHIPEHPGTELPVAEHGAVLRSISMRLTETSTRAFRPNSPACDSSFDKAKCTPFQGENHRLSGKMKMPSLLKYCLPIASCLWLSTHSSGDIFKEDIRPFLTTYRFLPRCRKTEGQDSPRQTSRQLWRPEGRNLVPHPRITGVWRNASRQCEEVPTNAESRKIQKWIIQSLVQRVGSSRPTRQGRLWKSSAARLAIHSL